MSNVPRPKSLLAFSSLLAGLCGAISASSAEVSMPQGIGIRLTMEGPAFVDGKGMTLYKINKQAEPAVVSCDDRRQASMLQSLVDGNVDFDVSVSDVQTRRSCIQKHAPLLAAEHAVPVGQWSMHPRKDGTMQWAYNGEPLFTSIKDRSPGEVNGSGAFSVHYRKYPWTIASAPLPGAPPGISVKQTVLGLALTNSASQTLYYPDPGLSVESTAPWRPVKAPGIAVADGLPDWSIVMHGDGSRQWAYKGKPLYTYVHDSGPEDARNRMFGDVFGGTYGKSVDGWHVAILKEGPAHPAGVQIRPVIEEFFESERTTAAKKIYVTSGGMALYTIQCVEWTGDRLDCDDVGDSPRYWLSFCGGEERCARTWRPLIAPSDVKPVDATWSVTAINPRNPWQIQTKSDHTVNVWTYRGRPVFTYAEDFRPGDTNGAMPESSIDQPMYADTITAYESASGR